MLLALPLRHGHYLLQCLAKVVGSRGKLIRF
jgi:hypothetical protein